MSKICLKISGISFFLCCLYHLNTYAQEILTWQDCVKEAKENHPDLISAMEKVKQVQADKTITKSTILPQITSELNGKKSKTAAKAESNTYSYSLTGKQLLFDGFKSLYDIKSASQNIKSVYYDYMVTSSNVRFNLRESFVDLLKAQKLVSLTEEIAQRRKKNFELIKLRYEAGREHKGALLTAEADLSKAEFEVAQAGRNLILAQRRLIKELGRKEFSPIVVKGELEIKNPERKKPVLEAVVENTPFLKEVIAKKEAARFNLKSAKSQFFPQVYFNSSLGKTSSDWPPEDEEWLVGASVSFPLFEGGSRIADVSKAKSQLKEKEAEEKSTRDSVIFTLEEEWKGFQDAVEKVSVQTKYLEAFRERAKIASAQYSTGLTSFNDWTIIEDNLVNAEKSYLDVQAEALIAQASWIQARGGTLDDEK